MIEVKKESKQIEMFDIIRLAKSAYGPQSLLADEAFKAALDAMAVVELKATQDALSKIE